ncbi:hypothetical protein GCM10028778_26220 [Barrientosiimonas marina]|uniref:DUF2642 domain-containing protein n=1 Tax=Lentibacillus kimchii TaxID=1542911 RepID=A0ABW2USE7_9BACI
MFQATLAAELATRVGSRVEIATGNNLIEGVLSGVTDDLVLVVKIDTGYDNTTVYLSLDAINFVRFPVAAA